MATFKCVSSVSMLLSETSLSERIKKMKDKIKDYFIILIFAIIFCIPLFSPDFNIYGDDGIQHIARLMGTTQSIAEGQILPLIMSNFCNGFGYSWNIFYSPITSYIPLIFTIFTNSFEIILKIFMFLITFLSGITMYEFVKKVTKNRYTALLASAIYTFAPYHLTDMYNRVAIAELATFIFIPLVFHGMYNIFNAEEKSFTKSLPLCLGAVGLILSQIVIAMYVAIICFIYLLVNIKKLKDKQVLKILGIDILLILLLTSFYTVPLLEHRISTDYEVFKDGRMERTDALVFYKVDPIDLVYTEANSLSFEIGLVSIIGLVFTIFAYKKLDDNIKKIYWFSLVAGILCVVFSLRFFPFEKLPATLKMLQFTFRLLEFSTFFFAFIAAVNFSLVIKNFKMLDVLVLSVITILLIVPLAKKNISYEKKWKEEALWPAVSVNEYTGRVHAGCASFEYLPSKAFEHLDYIKQRENKTYILNGSAHIENEEKNGCKMSMDISNVKNDTVIELPYIYYLGYTAQFTDINGDMRELDLYESDNGFVAINLSEDMNGNITVLYNGTALMWIFYAVSFITFIGVITFEIYKKLGKIYCKNYPNKIE